MEKTEKIEKCLEVINALLKVDSLNESTRNVLMSEKDLLLGTHTFEGWQYLREGLIEKIEMLYVPLLDLEEVAEDEAIAMNRNNQVDNFNW